MSIVLNALNEMDSLLWASTPDMTQDFSYSPYGNSAARLGSDTLTGFNGERLDPLNQAYHLGNGYRSYNPTLMRFTAPDSWSPFGAGGLNAYGYCEGDPINRSDPSGHMSWQVGVDLGLGIVSLLSTILTAGLSVAAAGGLMAALSAAEAVDLIAGGLGVAADITGITSAGIEEADPEQSDVLGWLSFALGIASLGSHAADFAHAKLSHSHESYDLSHASNNMTLDSAGKWANAGSEGVALTDTAYTLVDMVAYPPKLNSASSGGAPADKTSRNLTTDIGIKLIGFTGQLDRDHNGEMNSGSTRFYADSSEYASSGVDSPTALSKKHRLRSMRDRLLRSKPVLRRQHIQYWDSASESFKIHTLHNRVPLDGMPAFMPHAKPNDGRARIQRWRRWL